MKWIILAAAVATAPPHHWRDVEPRFPGDIVVCNEDEEPGRDCNCINGDEDQCVMIAWDSCDTDLDCLIKFGS